MKNSNCLNEKGEKDGPGPERTWASAPLTTKGPGYLLGDGSAGYAWTGVSGGI